MAALPRPAALYDAVMRSGRFVASPPDTGLQEIRSQRRGSHPRRHRGQPSQGHRQFFLAVGLILEFAGEVLLVGRHVEMAVTAEVEEDGFAFAFALAAHGFLDGALDSVVGLRRGHDAFVAGEEHAGLEALTLGVRGGFDLAQFPPAWKLGGVKLEPSVCILVSGVMWPVSPKS